MGYGVSAGGISLASGERRAAARQAGARDPAAPAPLAQPPAGLRAHQPSCFQKLFLCGAAQRTPSAHGYSQHQYFAVDTWLEDQRKAAAVQTGPADVLPQPPVSRDAIAEGAH
jgi:hypothetical protein